MSNVKSYKKEHSFFYPGQPMGVALIILAVLTVCAAAYSVQKSRNVQAKQQIAIEYNRKVLDCQNTYSEANSKALLQRTKAAGIDRAAAARDLASSIEADDSILSFINSLAAAQQLPADQQKVVASRRYQEFLDRADQIKLERGQTDELRKDAERTRQENPLPAATCPTPEPITGS